MSMANIYRNPCALRALLLLMTSTFMVAGCATSNPSAPSEKVAIQEQTGFTIFEEARISNDVRFDYDEALLLLGQGQMEQGIPLLEAVVEAAPHLTAPRIDLGIAYHRVGNLEAAESSLLQTLEANPDHPVAHNELGIVYRKSGRFVEARKSYEAALAFYPGYHFARRNLAVLCDLYLADLDCALENYEAYMTTVPSDEEATMWIADIRQRLGR